MALKWNLGQAILDPGCTNEDEVVGY